jgi:SIR2-like domain
VLIPLGLRSIIDSGNGVLFLGAGIGAHALDAEGQPAPDGLQLARELADQFSIPIGESADLAKVAQIVELRKGRAELQAFMTKRLAGLEPDDTLRWLFSRRWSAIYTTNYDNVIERGYELLAAPPQVPIPISVTSDLVQPDLRFEVPVYHIHGSLFHGDTPSLIITETDYTKFRERRRMLFELLKEHFAMAGFVYVGYSMRDPNWRLLQEEIRTEFYPRTPPRAYKISRSTDILDREILASMDIETLDSDLADFVQSAASTIGAPGSATDRLKLVEAAIPEVLKSALDANPAAVARLMTSWEFANYADFNQEPNVVSFLSGDLPNWGLVATETAFERDIETDLLDDLLDYATDATKKTLPLLILGPAGYGTSTTILRLVARLVREQAGPVLVHRRGTPLVEGDIEFAALNVGDHPFFVIDNAADVAPNLIASIQRLRDQEVTACILMGERVNEWRQVARRFSPKEFEIEPLSDAEITRLLDALQSQNALGVLGELEPSLRFSIIKERHEQQLLVAMREATEGRGFDAIIEDEYRNIADDFGRRLYAAVCCFYRLRVLVRVEVLARLLGCTSVELYERLTPSLEGVLRWEVVDESGTEVARARHHSIAEIVWNRAVEAGERDDLILSGLQSLNLAYRQDARAFEAFVRNDRLVDALLTFEVKTHFFETAMRKDPDNAYVRQHYARMLLREEKPEIALAQIEQAIAMAPAVRVLRHSKAGILRHMALVSESDEIARRRLVQSEEAYRETFSPARRDAYTYQGLAELYFGWAKRMGNEESAEYLTKAEGVINDGLKAVRPNERDGLWIVSAAIQRFLGDTPAGVVALEKAVADNPASVVGRYLLGFAYLRSDRPADAVSVLKPLIEQHPEEFRAAVIYAKALECLGEPYSRAIAILKLSTTDGLKDSRFIATLGGMLTMDGEFTQAESIFSQARRTGFGSKELARIEYVPNHDGNSAPRLEGRIISVRPAYAFIQVPGYLDFFLPGSRMGRRRLEVGMKLSFTPSFSARGGEATNVTFE